MDPRWKVHRAPPRFEDNGGVIPFEKIPGLPPLFRAFLRGEAAEFFPDEPTSAAVAARSREILPSSGRPVAIAAGQQAGLLGGPLLSLTKALAVGRLADELRAGGIAARGLFWIASEDHDLAEISRASWPTPSGVESIELATDAERNFRPAGDVLLPEKIGEIWSRIAPEPGEPTEALAAFQRCWAPGTSYRRAFRETLLYLLPHHQLEIIDPLDPEWRERKIEFFRKAVARAAELVERLDDVEARLRKAGFEPQVSRAKDDFPCFIIEQGIRRKVSKSGDRFSVYGHGESFGAAELSEFASRPGNEPSPAALLRPVLQAELSPVAAQVLGPSELAYHAQSGVLFGLFDLPRPVFLPRPQLFPRGARERRAQEALGIDDADLFRVAEVSRASATPLSARLRALEEEIAGRVGAFSAEVEAIDPTLKTGVESAAEKAGHPVAPLREKVERAAERRDAERSRRVESLTDWYCPGGSPADRVYTPLTYRLRFGPDFVSRLADQAECRVDGARLVEYE